MNELSYINKKEKIYESSLHTVFLRDIYERNVSIKVIEQNLASIFSKIARKLRNARKGKMFDEKIIL